MSVVILSRGQKKPRNDTVVGRANASTRVRLSAFFRISYESWMRIDHTSLSALRGHHSSLVLARGTLKPRASAMALPSTGIRLRRCVLTLPMSMSFFILARVSRDGAISAGWRATMGALLCVDRQVPGPPARNEGTTAPRRASSCPPAAVLAAKEEVRAAAPETAAEEDPLLLTAARLTAWSLAPTPAAPGAAAVVAAGVSVPSVRKEMGVRPATAARMTASANSSSSSPSSSVAS